MWILVDLCDLPPPSSQLPSPSRRHVARDVTSKPFRSVTTDLFQGITAHHARAAAPHALQGGSPLPPRPLTAAGPPQDDHFAEQFAEEHDTMHRGGRHTMVKLANSVAKAILKAYKTL